MKFEKPTSRTLTVLRRNYERLQRRSDLLEMYKIKCGNLLDEIKYQQGIITKLYAITDSDEEEKRILLGEKFDRIINEIELLETEEVKKTDSRFDKNMTSEDEFCLIAESIREEYVSGVNTSENVAYIANDFTNWRTDPICPDCFIRMKAVCPKHRSVLTYSDGKIVLQDNIFYSFECETCHKKVPHQFDSLVRKNSVLDDDFVSADFISMILKRKYEQNMSFLTQSIMYNSFGIDISYYTLSRWASEAVDRWLIPIYDAMHREITKSDILYCDNVCLRYFDLKMFPYADQKDFLWVYQTPSSAATPMVLYDFTVGNDSECSSAFLKNFRGTIVADKYESYKSFDNNVTVSGSWSMVKMLFSEANDVIAPSVQSEMPSFRIIKCCNKLYQVEGSIEEFDADIKLEVRKRNSLPVIEEIGQIIADSCVFEKDRNMKSEFALACSYFMEHKNELKEFVNDGRLKIDNTCAKEKLLPFVGLKGRKLVCLSGSLKREAAIYSLVESAKLCGLEVDRYLCFCLKNMSNPVPGKDISFLFPWNAPGECKEEFADDSDV